MTRPVRAILIDPFSCTVSEVEHDADDYKNIYRLISHEVHPVHCFTCAYSGLLQEGEAVFVDDNGLLNCPVRFFKLEEYEQPLAGKGLILGSDQEGDTCAATSSLESIKAAVVFAQVVDGKLYRTNTAWSPETIDLPVQSG